MPDTTSPADDPSEKKKGGPKRLITIGALCVGLLGGGYVLGGRLGSPPASADDGSAASAEGQGASGEEGGEDHDGEHAAEIGHVVDLEAVNINLAGDHYLRVAISLGLSPDVELEEPEEFHTAPASDVLLSTFSGATIEELSTAAGRDEARTRLLEQIEEQYHGEVAAVFFTEFVMQ